MMRLIGYEYLRGGGKTHKISQLRSAHRSVTLVLATNEFIAKLKLRPGERQERGADLSGKRLHCEDQKRSEKN